MMKMAWNKELQCTATEPPRPTPSLQGLSPAAQRANQVWANEQVRQALERIRVALPYGPTLPDEIREWINKN